MSEFASTGPATADQQFRTYPVSRIPASWRDLQAILQRYMDDALQGDQAVSGRSTQYRLDAPSQSCLDELPDGLILKFRPTLECSASPTVRVNQGSPKPIVRFDGSAIAQGDMHPNIVVEIIYRLMQDRWVLLSPRIDSGISADSVARDVGSRTPSGTTVTNGVRVGRADVLGRLFPVGAVVWAGLGQVLAGWLECDGSAVSRAEHSALFAVIGTTYGVGDGAATFNLPDLRGRAAIGAGQGTGLTDRALGSTGGAETHALTEQELAAHGHSVTVSNTAHSHANGTLAIDNKSHSHTISGNATSAGSHRHPVGRSVRQTTGSGIELLDSAVRATIPDPPGTSVTAGAGAHSHSVNLPARTGSAGAHTHAVGGSTEEAPFLTMDSPSGSVGGENAHENMMPWLALRAMIKA